ncbi:hypothetical protein N7456_006946 [Penicillium angulare]|uniref:Uncharacterized protein n=1 Tax=Penicillium angulare TaxID=116970 RepID=A0A9W9FIT8_9EURO|nr:hypothetical protein N7456_006946 [Penicillium angulare]
MSSTGISKRPDPKAKVAPSNVDNVVKMAENGSLSANKFQSGVEQALVYPANSNENQISYPDGDDLGRMHQDAPVEENSPHQPDKVIPSVESDDIEMQDFSPSRANNDQRQSAQSNRPDVQSDHPPPEVSSSQSQDTDGLVEGFKCLAVIDTRGKKKANRPTEGDPLDPNATVDGWGTLRGSTFVIVQEGPPHAAKFTFRYEPNYTNDRFANTTDKDFRISAIRDRTASGKKVYRYTTANVAGIYGALIENTGSETSTRSPCSWVKILWKGLRDDDKKTCQVAMVKDDDKEMCKVAMVKDDDKERYKLAGFSWIPKCEFVRFCGGREAAEETIKQVWDNQENQYAAWAENQPGSGGRRRGTKLLQCILGE